MRNWLTRLFASTGRQEAANLSGQTDDISAAAAALMQEADAEFERGNVVAASDAYRRVVAIKPGHAAAMRKLGIALKSAGQLQEAATALEGLVELEPGDAYSRYLLGEIAEMQGKQEDAGAHWQAVIAIAPDFEPAYQGLCRLLYSSGQLDQALQVATEGARHCPQSADMHFCLGNLQLGKQQYGLAEQAYRQAIAVQSERADILANLGLALAEQGRLEPAIAAMEQSLVLDPTYAVVHKNLADALFKAGRADAGLASLGRAAAIDPAYAAAMVEWGDLLLEQNRLNEAIACFRQFLQGQPENIPTLLSLANALHRTQQWDSAAQAYEDILKLLPEDTNILCNLGANAGTAGDNERAIAYYRRALLQQPGHVGATNNLAAILLSQGKLDDAAALYLALLSKQPDVVEARFNLAKLYRTQEKWMESAAQYEHVLHIAPDHVDALLNLGICLQSQGLQHEAMSRYSAVLAIEPENHDALINLGVGYEETGELGAALACYEKLLQTDPASLAAHVNMAAALTLQGRLSESITCCERALEIAPHHPDAHYSRGLSLLRLGRYEEGWKEYEYRWARSDAPPKPEFPGEEWRGHQDLLGKTILLYSEQGLGDTMQFVRYMDQVAARGATIILELQAALFPLLKDMKGIDRFVVRGDPAPLPAYDFQCSLLSLPAVFNSSLATIPMTCPYLHAPADRVAYWTERLGTQNAPKIGLSWAGNPQHKNDRNRSTTLAALAPLWSPGTWQFLSLQKERKHADAFSLRHAPTVTDLSASLSDLAETAAIIANLDLLITVDSSLAHLAGALNIPVWIMLPYLPDFRWMMERGDSPWYPSARLFRQGSPGDWPSVVDAIGQALAERFGNVKTI